MGSGISQATGQIEGLGEAADQTQKKAKSSGMGVGAAFQFVALNAFNLASSLIQTKRSYEDLDKAENIQKNKRLAVTVATNNQTKAEIALKKAQLSHDPARIAKAELTLENAKIKVDKATRAEKLGQVELNRAHEDFYLNIIPNVVSGLGTVFGLFQVMQGAGGIGGLIGSFTKLAIPVLAISGIFLAIKTNFLGFRDFLQGLGADIGNAIPALKPFLNVLESIGELLGLIPSKKGKGTGINKAVADLKAQFGPILDFFKNIIDDIMKGNWEKVFQRIIAAATNAWEQLKKAFPLLGDIESLVNKIKNGNWKGALLQIWVAAVSVWETIKKAVPFLGDIEAFIRGVIKGIQTGKWDDAFKAIKDAWDHSGIPGLIDSIFGKGAIGGFQEKINTMVQTAKNSFNQLEHDLNAPGGAISKINEGFAKIGQGDVFGGLGGIAAGIQQAISQASNALNQWVLQNFGINLAGLEGGAMEIGRKILNAIKSGLTFIARTWIDPFLTQLFDYKVWTEALKAQAQSITKGGGLILGAIMEAIFPKDKKKADAAILQQSANLLSIWNAIVDWMTTNLPDTTKAAQAFVGNLVTGITKTFTFENVDKILQSLISAMLNGINQVKQDFQNVGDRIGNFIGQGIKSAVLAVLNALPFFPGSNLDEMRKKVNSIKTNAAGFHGFISGGQLMSAGERGIEKVDITPMSDIVNRRTSGNGGGTSTIIVYSVLDGQVIAESVAKRISVNQAVYR